MTRRPERPGSVQSRSVSRVSELARSFRRQAVVAPAICRRVLQVTSAARLAGAGLARIVREQRGKCPLFLVVVVAALLRQTTAMPSSSYVEVPGRWARRKGNDGRAPRSHCFTVIAQRTVYASRWQGDAALPAP
jgi:hypothetical protein